MPTKQSVITLHPKSVIKIPSAIAIFLVIANVLFNFVKYITGDRFFYGLIPLFQLSAENNIPAFFSGCLFLINAALLILIWKAKRINADPQTIWAFLSGLFLFLAFDELFKVHELLIDPLRETLGTFGLLYFAWVIVYGAGVVLLSFLFFPVWWRLNKTVKLWLALSAIIYLGGALGFEMVGGAYFEAIEQKGDLIYGALYTIEESLEMAGLIMFIYALLLLLQKEFDEVTIIISDKKRQVCLQLPYWV